ARLTNRPWPITRWSWIRRSRRRAHSTSCRVSRMSSRLGVGSPLGWLWSRITEAADSRIAGLNTSRGCTRLADSVPCEITRSRRRPFCASRSAMRNTSRLRSSMSGPNAAYTSAGPDRTTRAPGIRALRRRVSSNAATSRAALTGPTPECFSSSASSRPATPPSEPYAANHARAAEHLQQAQIHQLGHAARPVGVDVIDGHAARVLVDEDEGRARGADRGAETPNEPLDEAGLPCTELARQRDDGAGPEGAAQPLAGGLGRLGAGAGDVSRRRHPAS